MDIINANLPTNGSFKRRNSTDEIILHHAEASRASVEEVSRWHLERGWTGIGYHFYIRKDGKRVQGRKLLEVGAHAVPYNRCSIGVCYEGGLDENGRPCNTMTEKQRAELTDLLTILHKLFPKARIVGHRDLPGTVPKACPCLDTRKVFGWIEGE